MKITRRKAMTAIGVGGAGIAAAGGAAYWKFGTYSSGQLVAHLKKRFSYLTLEVSQRQFAIFVEEYIERHGPVRVDQGAHYSGNPYREMDGGLDGLASQFLLSTDFFKNGADESRPVRIVAYFHPYDSSCWTPLARDGKSATGLRGGVRLGAWLSERPTSGDPRPAWGGSARRGGTARPGA